MIEGQNSGDSDNTLTVDSAASMLEGLLSGSEDQQDDDADTDDKTPAAQSSSKDDEGEESDASGDKSDSDEEESEPSESGEDESEEESEQPGPKHRLKVDGEEIEVTLDELLKGYSRTQDYTRKTQKLSEDRRKIETELQPEREAVRAERQRYATQLTELEGALTALVQEPDWDTLRMESPETFADTWAAWDQHSKRLKTIADERTRAENAVRQDYANAETARLATERGKLLEAIPAWSDKSVAKKESDDLLVYGKKLGFAEDELRQVSDHRALVTLRKAMLFDRAEAAKAENKKTAEAKIEKVRVAAPGAKGGKPKASEQTLAKQRHGKVGSVDSAAAALLTMLDD